MAMRIFKNKYHKLVRITLIITALGFCFFANQVKAEEETATTTPEVISPVETPTTTPITEPEPTRTTVNLNLRYQNSLIFSNQVILPTSTLIIDSAGAEHFTTSTNALTALLAADATSTDFRVSDLQYYETYKSFYVNCVEITATSTPLCANWNYVVSSTYPGVGMDKYPLTGNENIYVYFDNPWKITASTSTFPLNTTSTLQTWRYNYDNLENEWTVDANNLIDISIPNPNPTGLWDSTVTVATTTTDDNGTADYLFSTTGTFYAKITSPDWTKWSNSITLTVFDLPSTPTTTSTSTPPQDNPPPDNGGGGGGGNNNDEPPANPTVSDADIKTAVDKILAYLKSQQDATGKIIDGGTTDWAIMSFGANGQYADELLNFAKTYNFTDSSELNLCAGYPRHILALLAGGTPANDSAILNLKSKINSECYKDNLYGQIGINDDVFGVLALLAAGASPTEPIVQSAINTIKADQTTDGAFTWAGWPGADITGAAINALKYAETKGASIDPLILTKAKTYLKTTQLEDGGWGFDVSDPLATGWVIMGINALALSNSEGLGEKQTDWTKNNKNPWHVLVEKLSPNGYYEAGWAPGTVEWFSTKHAVPALLGKPWPIILPPRVAQPEAQPTTGGTTQNTNNITQTPTTTPPITPTSTPPLSTFYIPLSTTSTPEYPSTSAPEHPSTSLGTDLSTSTETITISTTKPIAQISPISYLLSPTRQPEITTPANPTSQTLSSAPPPISPEPANPVTNAAKKLFAGSSIAAGGLGLYLAWRLLQTVV